MKKHLLLTAAMIYSALSFAQIANTKHDPKNIDPLTRSILQKQYANAKSMAAYKTTGTSKRLIASAYRFAGEVTDSTHFYYSEGRGSDLSDPGSYTDSYFPTAYSDLQTIKSDSSIHWGATGGVMDIREYRSYQYGKSKPIKMDFIDGGGPVHYDIGYKNDTLRDTVVTSDTTGSGTLSPKLQMICYYDANGIHTADSMVSAIIFQTLAKVEYGHDANGNLTSYNSYTKLGPSWMATYSMVYTYDNSNRVTSVVTQTYGGPGGLVNSYKDSFIYNGSAMQYAQMYYYTWSQATNDWTPNYLYANTYNAAGFIDTNILMAYSTQWDTLYKAVYVYDNTGLLCQNLYSYPYLGNGTFSSTASDTQTYYYEQYFPAEIKKASVQSIGISLYPNPGTNSITVETPLLSTGSISITNAAGQLLYNASYNSLSKQTIDIHQLPKGNYILTVKDDKKQHIYQRQFVKI